jgi:Resolvase, N terminal domain
MTRIAIYRRKRTDKQSASSLDDQLRLCRALAERNGWTVVSVYEDDAVSGALKGRKGYLTLVADAINGSSTSLSPKASIASIAILRSQRGSINGSPSSTSGSTRSVRDQSLRSMSQSSASWAICT